MDMLFLEYDDTLIKRLPAVGAYNFYGPDPGGANEQRALSCIRYCIEKILKWDPEEAVKKFDEYMIHLMGLDKIINYINWPVEISYGDPRYILSLLYPDRVHMNQQQIVEDTYREVLDGGKQFPREYFTGATGFRRFGICLKFLIENYHPVSSLDELYRFFLSSSGKKLLYDYRLKVPADQFSINIMDVINYITRNDPDGELFFCYYQFLTACGSSLDFFAVPGLCTGISEHNDDAGS